jgi:HK97 family phage major capsid protein
VWGLPVVISNSLPADSALMGDFNQAVVFARDQASVEVDPYSSFATNQTRFRAEQRLGLGVVRPAGFVEIALA